MQWLSSNGNSISLDLLFAAPKVLARLARSYGIHLYRSNASRQSFTMLITALQRHDRSIRAMLGEAWDLNTAWEWIMPVQHRPPLAFALYKAITSLALCFAWHRFAATIILGFKGIARPTEVRTALRENIVLPIDALNDACEYILVHVLAPKTRRRGARTQYLQVTGTDEVAFLQALLRHAAPQEQVFAGSASAHRSLWNKLLGFLGIPPTLRFTPASCRAGGAVHAFQSGLSIEGLLWRMRVTSQQTLAHYLQEVVASTSLRALSPLASDRVLAFSRLYPVVLNLRTRQLEALGSNSPVPAD